MSENTGSSQARTVFDAMCKMLDSKDWHYESDEKEMAIECGARGEDLPMKITLRVDEERRLVLLFSRLPYDISEEKRIDIAVAVSAVNNMLVDGSFDFDITDGSLFFRMTNSYIDSVIGEDAFEYLLLCACKTIDDYNDKFLMIEKGVLPLEKFIESI